MTTPTSRTLWLLRHAKAVADPPPGGEDFDRVLAPRGRRDAEALGRLIGPGGKGFGLGKVAAPAGRPRLPGRPHRRHGRARARQMARRPTRRSSRRPLRGRSRGCPGPPARRSTTTWPRPWWSGTTRRPGAGAWGSSRRATRTGRDLVARRGFPTCALGIYRLDVAGLGRGGGAVRHAPRPVRPALRRGPDAAGSAAVADAQDGGVALAAAAAERDRGRAGAAATQLEQRGERHPGPDMPTGWPEGDGAAVDVDLALVDAQIVGRGQADGGEGLVDLEEVDGADVDARPSWPPGRWPARAGSAARCPARPPCRSRRSGPAARCPAPWPWPPT